MPDKPVSRFAKSDVTKSYTVVSKVVEPSTTDFSMLNQQCAPLSLRLQTEQDFDWVEQLHNKSFGPGRFTRVAFLMRESLELDPDLCLIGEINGERAGSVWMTQISLNNVDGYLLGPLATKAERRNQGIGGNLVRAVTAMALEKLPQGFVLLVGDAPYYQPFGYKMAAPGTIEFPGPVDPRRVLVCHNRPSHAKELAGIIVGR